MDLESSAKLLDDFARQIVTIQQAERRGLDPEEYKAERAKGIPVQRVGVPRDVANLVCFLASDEASFVSGQIVYVSGGPETRR